MTTFIGTTGNDTLTGTASADDMFGLPGDDSILGGAGDDTIIGGSEFLPIGGGMLEPITGDVIVHASTSGPQNLSATAALTGGGYVVTWGDPNSTDRFIQIMDDSGNLVGSAITAAGVSSFAAIAGLSNGDFAVATLGRSTGLGHGIVVEIFDAGGTPVASPFLANTTYEVSTPPNMTALSGGGFVVTWDHDNGGGDHDILAQMFSNSGSAVGSEFTVNDTTSFAQGSPEILGLSGGNFVVSWQGYGSGDSTGVYAKIYDDTGSVVASEFALNTTTTGEQKDLRLAALENGNFLAMWETNSASVQAQIFDPTGSAVGSEIDLGTLASTTQLGAQSIHAVGLPNGGFLLTYSDGYANPDLYAQMYDASGTKVGIEVQVNRDDVYGQFAESVVRLANDNLVFTGVTGTNGDDVFTRVLSFDGSGGSTPPSDDDYLDGGSGDDSILGGAGADTIIGGSENLPIGGGTLEALTGDVIVHASTTGTQQLSATAALTGGGYVVTWGDANSTDRLVQIMDDSGNTVGSAFTVGANATSFAAIAGLSNGGFAVATLGNPGHTLGYGIVIDLFDASGTPVGSPFLANTTYEVSTPPNMTALSGGGFVVTWDHDNTGGDHDILAQIFDNSGVAVGSEFTVNDTTSGTQGTPRILGLSNGSFVVAWQGTASGDSTGVYAKIYDGSGSLVASEFALNTTITGGQATVRLTELENGNFLALWQTDGLTAQAQIFDPTGSAVGSEIDLATITSTTQFGETIHTVGLPNGGFLITYSDGYADPDLYAQMYDDTGAKVGIEIQVNRDDLYGQYADSVVRLANDSLVFTGLTGAGGTDDIFTRVISFDGSGGTTPLSDDDFLDGGSGDDSILGGAGADTIIGGSDSLLIGGGSLEAVTGDVIVHSSTTGAQQLSATAALTGGGYVVTWGDANSTDRLVQIMDDSGSPVGSAFTVGANATSFAAVGGLSNGGFAVATLGNPGHTLGYGIIIDLFDSSGTPVGSPFLANTTYETTTPPHMAGLSGGGFVVTWEHDNGGGDRDILSQIFDNSGSAVGSEFTVNDSTSFSQNTPEILALSNGGFVVAWQGTGPGDTTGVFAKVYDGSGSVVASEFALNTITASEQRFVRLTELANGNFLALWQTDNTTAQARIFDSSGSAVGNEINLGTITSTTQFGESIRALGLPNGGFLITYSDGWADPDLYAQMYDATGTKVGIEIQVNQDDLNGQYVENLIQLANEDLVFTGLTGAGGTDDIFSRILSFDDSGGTTPPSDDDYLDGGSGNDSILGGAGDDTLIGGSDSLPIGGGALEAISDDVIVHASTSGPQQLSATAALTGGGYVVTWGDNTSTDRFIQIMDDSGNPVGSAFAAAGVSSFAAIAGLSNGDFAVATLGDGTGLGYGIVVEIFDSGGTPVGSPFLANTTYEVSTPPNMTALSGGGFVVTWDHDNGGGDHDILAQIIDNSGSAVGSEFTVNDTTSFAQVNPEILGLNGGNFVVSWQGTGPGDTAGVFAKVYDGSGSLVASEFALNTTTTGAQGDLRLAALENGNFLAMWETNSASVQAQIFDPTGAAVGSEIDLGTLASTTQLGAQSIHAVGLPNGGFLLTYSDGYANPDLYAQMYDASGTKVGIEVQVNRDDVYGQFAESVVRLANDNLVFTGITGTNSDDVFTRVISFDGSGGTTPAPDDDYLNGGSGDDSILGGAGDDTIIGGTGVDTIHGGQGADTFIYSSLSASGVGSSNRDIIADFNQSQGDEIDLAGLAGTFSFIGNSSFSSAPNQLRYSIDTPNNRTVIEADTNGDGTADMQLQLTGQLTLVSGDFVL